MHGRDKKRNFASEIRKQTRDMATTVQPKMMKLNVSIPKVDFNKFKSFFNAMGWTFEDYTELDETEYVKSNPKIMEAIQEGDAAIQEGNIQTTRLEDLWN